jgi:vesicle-fusing ATPase
MKKHNRVSQEALERLPELAQLTKNFTGAEIEGMVRAAASFPLARTIDAASKTIDEASLKVCLTVSQLVL